MVLWYAVEQTLGSATPTLGDYIDIVLFGRLWRHSGLSPHDFSFVPVTALIVGNKSQQLVGR